VGEALCQLWDRLPPHPATLPMPHFMVRSALCFCSAFDFNWCFYYSLKLLLSKTLADEQSEGLLIPTDQEENSTEGLDRSFILLFF
jgi:hypothetical protein